MTALRQSAGIVTALVLLATSASAQSAQSKGAQPKGAQPKSGQLNDAQLKALQTRVWVNRDTKVYHCPSSIYFGKTRSGEFMEEAQARGYGNRAVEGQGCKNVVTNGPAPLPLASNAARRMVWVNTESGVYHCPNASDWGMTRRGHYLTESNASAAGHKPAAGKSCGSR